MDGEFCHCGLEIANPVLGQSSAACRIKKFDKRPDKTAYVKNNSFLVDRNKFNFPCYVHYIIRPFKSKKVMLCTGILPCCCGFHVNWLVGGYFLSMVVNLIPTYVISWYSFFQVGHTPHVIFSYIFTLKSSCENISPATEKRFTTISPPAKGFSVRPLNFFFPNKLCVRPVSGPRHLCPVHGICVRPSDMFHSVMLPSLFYPQIQ